MKMNRFGKIYQLTTLPYIFPINFYIFEEMHELTLIDTGLQSSFNGIVRTIEKIDKPLTNIILTHAHGDHLGSLDRLKETFPHACVSMSTRDHRLLKGDKSLDPKEPQTPIKGDVPKNLTTVPDRLLKEGDRIGSLEVIDTPGHTPGSISLFCPLNRSMFVGDAMQTRGKMAVAGQFVLQFPFPAFGTWNKEMSLESAKKILKLKPSLLAVGHGSVITNPEDNIKLAIESAERKLRK
jgi:glyoxylase-like metal-dependent hydrolase (beta-lactamase superfamily II)